MFRNQIVNSLRTSAVARPLAGRSIHASAVAQKQMSEKVQEVAQDVSTMPWIARDYQ